MLKLKNNLHIIKNSPIVVLTKKDKKLNLNIIKTFATTKRFNVNKNQNEVKCDGFFNGDFFTLIEVIKRQEEVYNLYLQNDKYKNECGVMYEALEHMRVSLIK